MPCDELLNNGTVGNPSKKFRFSKRYLARNVSMSLIGSTTKGDSNSLDGEEAEFTGEERAAALRVSIGMAPAIRP
jgi:hypothetical protein